MSPEPNVWVVDDDASVRWVLDKALQAEGVVTRCFEGADELLDTSEQCLVCQTLLSRLSDSEVHEQAAAGSEVQQNVVWLDVAMDHAGPVSKIKRAGNVFRDSETHIHRQLPLAPHSISQ